MWDKKKELHSGSPITFYGEIKADSKDILNCTIDMALACGHDITHYKIKKNKIKFFNDKYSSENYQATLLPFKLNKSNAHDFIYNTMIALDDADIPSENPSEDCDGFGFTAKFGEFGQPILTIDVTYFYYSK